MADAVVTAPPEKAAAPAPVAEVKPVISAPTAAAPAPATPAAGAAGAAAPVAKEPEKAKEPEGAAWMEEKKKEEAKPDATAPQAEAFDAKSLKLPEGAAMEPARLEAYASFAKESGLTQSQTEKLIARDLGQEKASHETILKQLGDQDAKWLGEYKQKLGDKFTEQGEKLKRVFEFGDPNGTFRQGLRDMRMAYNPQLMEFVSAFIPLFEEDRLKGPSGQIPAGEDKRTLDEKLDAQYREKMSAARAKQAMPRR